MRGYRQLTSGERYALELLHKQGRTQAEIAQTLERAPSTISRELQRNRRPGRSYSAFEAGQQTRGRRSRSRRNQRFTPADWALVIGCLEELWSPEQISGRLKETGELQISHETIYRFVWLDKKQGGTLYLYLRQAGKKRRKRYGRYDSRGRLAGKRHISERPPGAENRSRLGHWEVDTMVGPDKHCVLTLVERRIGLVLIAKLRARTVAELNRAAIRLINEAPLPVRTITADNGTEFHGYKDIEATTGVRFFFATPHHSWERGTSENTNGLIRQYLPKRQSMARLSQAHCDWIAQQLNNRPRKRLHYLTPEESYDTPSCN
jgi:IS30 family transposase